MTGATRSERFTRRYTPLSTSPNQRVSQPCLVSRAVGACFPTLRLHALAVVQLAHCLHCYDTRTGGRVLACNVTVKVDELVRAFDATVRWCSHAEKKADAAEYAAGRRSELGMPTDVRMVL